MVGSRRSILVGLVAALLVGGPLTAGAEPGGGAAEPRAAAADGGLTDQLIVSYAPGRARLGGAELERVAGRGARIARALDAATDVVKLPGARRGAELAAVVRAVAARPGVVLVEPDLVMQPLSVPNDPSFTGQWDLSDPAVSGVYGINAPAAWDLTTGSSALTVAVIDTGYLPHADLAGRIAGGYDFISDSRIGNDGNARDASALDPGDWITSTEAAAGFFAGCQVSNSSWHGTHVAGTIGAATDNSAGIAGINRTSKILAVRVLGKCGGYTSDIVDGMKWAAGLPVTGVPANATPARVLNLSLGGSGACSSTYQTAIDAITAAGAVVVVAAGNSNANAANYSPASCNGVITVGATGKAGSRSYYSNFGTTVEISAPGGDKNADAGDTILSTLNTGTTGPAADAYVKYQGTSMATPHVVGVVSLMLSRNPSLTPAQVTQIVRSTARAFPAGSTCSTTTCGAGVIDAAAAVAAAGTPPPPPVPGAFGKTAPSNGSRVRTPVTLTWASSANATGYRYCIDTSNDNACTANNWVSVSATRATPTLTRGVTYYWQVQAVNVSGTTTANAGTWWSFTTR